MTNHWTKWNPVVQTEAPLMQQRPCCFWVGVDLFSGEHPDEFVDAVFAVMALTPHHQYQVATWWVEQMVDYLRNIVKRIDADFIQAPYVRCVELRRVIKRTWPLPNVWLGAKIENQVLADKGIPLLQNAPAAKRFLLCRPTEPINFTVPAIVINGVDETVLSWRDLLSGQTLGVDRLDDPIDWVAITSDSDPALINSIAWQCQAAGVPFEVIA